MTDGMPTRTKRPLTTKAKTLVLVLGVSVVLTIVGSLQALAEDVPASTSSDAVVATEAATEDTAQASETTDAATTPDDSSATVQSDAVPQATGVHFTKLELRKGSVDGDVVCDLLTNTTPQLEAGQEYYICVEVTKDAETDDCWVALDLPWWTTPKNMIGGDNWMTPGSSVTSTSLDKVVGYTASTGYSNVLTSTAGKVWYHIKDSATSHTKVAAFQCSFTPTAAYFDGNAAGQTWTAAPLSFSVGDMNGEVAGGATQTISSNPATITGTGGFNYYSTSFPNCGLNDSERSSRDMWITGAGASTVWKTVEFDATYPTEATMGDITYGGFTAAKGTPVANGDGTTTVHCTVTTAGSQTGGIAATASFPTTGTKVMSIKNVKATVWGDETTYTPTTETTLEWNVYDGPGTMVLNSTDITRFDWLGQEGITNDMLVGFVQMACQNGAPVYKTNSQDIDVTYDKTNLDVRTITVPVYTDHGTTITINGTSHALADVATTVDETNHYAVITADKCGVTEIETCHFTIGKVDGGARSTDNLGDYGDVFGDLRLGSWGSFTKGVTAKSTYTIYETGTDPTDTTNTTVHSATATANPTATKTMTYYSEPNGGSLSKTAMMAGDTTHFSASFITGQWPQTQGVTSAYDATEAYYMTLPAGFKVENVKLNDTATTLTDVTDTATNVPDGMKIYRVDWPEGMDRQTGTYTADNKVPYQKVDFDLTTSPYMDAGTYNIKDFFRIGTDPDAAVSTTYRSTWGNANLDDTYGLNDGNTMTAPSKEFTIQPYAGISVTNSMSIIKNGEPLNTWMTYDDTDPDNTSGTVTTGFKATYKVSITNQTDKTATGVEVYVPVPKIGQDFGEAFTPDGAQEFNLTLTADSVPAGWTVHYLKMNAGVSYSKGQYPAEATTPR